MYLLHDAVVRPLLDAVGATSVLEVGADQGEHTQLLQRWCRSAGAHLEVIETVPSEAFEAAVDPDCTTVHIGTSQDLIPDLPPVDVALIDGDHNYWTVAEELRLLGEHAAAHDRPLPLLLFHDVWWPYGRRDMYYDPDRIPDEHRHPWSRRAIRLGEAGLVDPPGFNLGFANAELEGGPRNGVRTAIEDVAAALPGSRLEVLPALHGFGVLASAERLAASPPLADLLDRLAADSPLGAVLLAVEEARLAALQQVMDEAWVKAHAEHDLDEARHALEEERAAAAAARGDADAARAEADQRAAEAASLRALLEEERRRTTAATTELDAIRASTSYRLASRAAATYRRVIPRRGR